MVRSFSDIDVGEIYKTFYNYVAIHDRERHTETHYFKDRKHAEDFLGARCFRFTRRSTKNNLVTFSCLEGEEGLACDAKAQWDQEKNIVFVSFSHSNHDPAEGQGRVNDYEVSVFHLFANYFWRRGETQQWNMDNIIFCLKAWFGPKNVLYHLTELDFYAFRNTLPLKFDEVLTDEQFHFTLTPEEETWKNLPSPPLDPNVDESEISPYFKKRGYTKQQWNIEDTAISTIRQAGPASLRIPISKNAFLMAKHILEFSDNFLRFGFAISKNPECMHDCVYRDFPRLELFKKANFTLYQYVNDHDLNEISQWTKSEIDAFNLKARKKFDEKGALKFQFYKPSTGKYNIPAQFKRATDELPNPDCTRIPELKAYWQLLRKLDADKKSRMRNRNRNANEPTSSQEKFPMNILTSYKVPANGYIPLRIRYMTGLPLEKDYQFHGITSAVPMKVEKSKKSDGCEDSPKFKRISQTERENNYRKLGIVVEKCCYTPSSVSSVDNSSLQNQ